MSPQVVDTYVSEDVFIHVPDSRPERNGSHDIILLIPGNPGLLGYYHEFLSLLSAATPCSPCTIASFSLGGFEVSPSPPPESIARIQHPSDAPAGSIYTLQDQIDLTYRRIETLVHAIEQDDQAQHNVILIGHSVGAYIALEVIWRLHEARSKPVSPMYTITGAILLTPTVIDIAKSSHGRVVAPLLACAPFVDRLAQWAVWGLVRTLPRGLLEGLVGRVTGMEGEKLRTTLGWLGSEGGVRQTICMGGQEMREIGRDRWGEEVWGAVEETPRVVLYFARKDHWVSDVTREEILKARRKRKEVVEGKDKSWPRIEIEPSGKMVHGWCIEQSKEVAERVTEWITEIIGSKSSHT